MKDKELNLRRLNPLTHYVDRGKVEWSVWKERRYDLRYLFVL